MKHQRPITYQDLRNLALYVVATFVVVSAVMQWLAWVVPQTPPECDPIINETETHVVYVLDKKQLAKLPFCSMTTSPFRGLCQDYASWAGHEGIGIFNITF